MIISAVDANQMVENIDSITWDFSKRLPKSSSANDASVFVNATERLETRFSDFGSVLVRRGPTEKNIFRKINHSSYVPIL